jgi:Clr5 domain
MDLFEMSTFAAALPTEKQIAEQNLNNIPDEQSSQHLFVYPNVSREPGVRKMSSRQWESLKPLIERIYIIENKPFHYVAQLLRDEHGFEPT